MAAYCEGRGAGVFLRRFGDRDFFVGNGSAKKGGLDWKNCGAQAEQFCLPSYSFFLSSSCFSYSSWSSLSVRAKPEPP